MQQREKNKERKTTYENKDESLKQIILSQRSQNKKKIHPDDSIYIKVQ